MSISDRYLHHPVKAALFDMDGLMLDSERLALECWREAASQLGAPIHEEIILGMVGMHVNKTTAWLSSQLGDDYPAAEVRASCNQIYLERTRHLAIPLRPGIEEMLDWLEQKNITKAVATSTQRQLALHHLKQANLLPRFAFAVCGDDIAHPKPAPDIYLAAATRLNIAPEECLVFEDSNYGVQAAHAAGCQVIMVPDLHPPIPEVMALGHPITQSLHGALAFLEKHWP